MASMPAWLYVSSRIIQSSLSRRKDVVGCLLGEGEWTCLGERDCSFEFFHHLGFDSLEPGSVEFTLFPQSLFEQSDWIPSLPSVDLGSVARVRQAAALGMSSPAVGLALNERRTSAGAGPVHGRV